jgi:glycosyltransferase involved in cell wall biosynthesis
MAAGRPLLYIGPKTGTPATYIDRFQCGWWIEPGDADTLIGLLKRIADDRQSIHRAGRRAREAFEQYFDRSIGVARVSAAIHSVFASDEAGNCSAETQSPQIAVENEPRQQLSL